MVTNNKELILELIARQASLSYDNWGQEMNMVNKDYEAQLKNEGGDAVKLYSYGDVTINTGEDIVHSGGDISSQTLSVDTINTCSIPTKLIDFEQVKVSRDSLIGNWKKREGVAMSIIRANKILGFYSSAYSNNVLSQIVLDKNKILGWLRDMHKALSNSNALDGDGKSLGKGEYPYVMLNPDILRILSDAPGLDKNTREAEERVKEGVKRTVNLIEGFKVLSSTHFAAVGGVYNTMFGTTDGITYASQISKSRIINENPNDWNEYMQWLYAWVAYGENPKSIGHAAITIA